MWGWVVSWVMVQDSWVRLAPMYPGGTVEKPMQLWSLIWCHNKGNVGGTLKFLFLFMVTSVKLTEIWYSIGIVKTNETVKTKCKNEKCFNNLGHLPSKIVMTFHVPTKCFHFLLYYVTSCIQCSKKSPPQNLEIFLDYIKMNIYTAIEF